MKSYDAAIVGSGPAGLAAAHLLASGGMRVALIDKCAFPREKLCGGLLSGRARAVFHDVYGDAWGPGVEHEAYGVRLLHRGRLLNSVDTPHTLYLASRAAFDAHLFSLTARPGMDVLQGEAVTSVDPSGMTVHFRSRAPLKADFVVGADGVASRVARSLFPDAFRKRDLALCFQSELPRSAMPDAPAVPEVHFGHVRWGYAWVFPKKDTLSVGLGGLLGKNRDMRSLFLDFHRQATGGEPASVKSGYIPCGNCRSRPGAGSILLAGDAAGLVEPITGEGIAYAMLSGQYAAQSILQAARQGDPRRAYGLYRKKYGGIARVFALARVLRVFMSSSFAEPMFVRELGNATGIVEQYLALIAGRTTYARITGRVLSKMARDVLAMITPGRQRG
jgi:menaquinone-9 beta-reductase